MCVVGSMIAYRTEYIMVVHNSLFISVMVCRYDVITPRC